MALDRIHSIIAEVSPHLREALKPPRAIRSCGYGTMLSNEDLRFLEDWFQTRIAYDAAWRKRFQKFMGDTTMSSTDGHNRRMFAQFTGRDSAGKIVTDRQRQIAIYAWLLCEHSDSTERANAVERQQRHALSLTLIFGSVASMVSLVIVGEYDTLGFWVASALSVGYFVTGCIVVGGKSIRGLLSRRKSESESR